jgi:hypothetical protein
MIVLCCACNYCTCVTLTTCLQSAQCQFYNNTGSTQAYGGAISVGASDESSYIYIADCSFETNSALFYDGGVILHLHC